jgi:hypothetical protein
MINIENEDLFWKGDRGCSGNGRCKSQINTFEKTRAINAIAKAAHRIQTSGSFMEFR